LGELADRRKWAGGRLDEIKERLGDTALLAKDKACVYATGSFGRCEASPHSDLDLFIVGKTDATTEGSQLTRLDEICIKADLIHVTRELSFSEFSRDGRYLTHHSVHDFTKTLGTPEDDVTNTFTARLLLLLESRPLVEPSVYNEIIEEVVAAYWRDYEDHENNFMPAFLANDILRLWRTFCVNYEARTERVPDQEKAKGKLKNYKLKHSRLLTCYSAILCLLAVYRQQKAVAPSDAIDMIKRTPTERLEWLLDQPDFDSAHGKIDELIGQYERFLAVTRKEEPELIREFIDRQTSVNHMNEAHEFGDLVFAVLQSIGGGTRFQRLLTV
jgi:hypothetical protein